MAIFLDNPMKAVPESLHSTLDFIGTKDEGAGVDNWSYKNCKAPVKSSPPTNRHPAFYKRFALLAQPTVSEY